MNNVIPAWILAIPDVGENVITPDGGLGKLIKKKDGMGVVCFCESIVKTYHLRDLKRSDHEYPDTKLRRLADKIEKEEL